MIGGSKKVAARATSRYADITTATPAAATAAAGVPLPGSGALGSLAVRSAPTGSAARCVRLSQMQPDATPRGAITGLPLENQGGLLGRSI